MATTTSSKSGRSKAPALDPRSTAINAAINAGTYKAPSSSGITKVTQPTGGTYNPTTGVYTSPTGVLQSRPSAPTGAIIVGAPSTQKTYVGGGYQPISPAPTSQVSSGTTPTSYSTPSTLKPSASFTGSITPSKVSSISMDYNEPLSGSPLNTKWGATKASAGILWKDIGILGTALVGGNKDYSNLENPFKPFEYASETKAVALTSNPYYAGPQSVTINPNDITQKPYASGIDIRNENIARAVSTAPTEVQPYIGMSSDLAGVRIGESLTKTYQAKVNTGELDVDTATTLAQQDFSKIAGQYSKYNVGENTLGSRTFSADKFTSGLKTAGYIGASIAVPAVAVVGSYVGVYKGFGLASNPNLSTKQRLMGGAIGGVSLVGGTLIGRSYFNALERAEISSDIQYLVGKNTQTIQPYYEARFTSPKLDVGYMKATMKTSGVGSVETNIFSKSTTIKPTANTFVSKIQTSAVSTGELSFRPLYNPDKFIAVSYSTQAAKGILLPSNIGSKGFSVYQTSPQVSAGSTALFSNTPTAGTFNTLANGLKTSTTRGGTFFGQSTQLKPNLYLGKSSPLLKLNLDTTSGKFNWAALTTQPTSRGFTKTFEIPSTSSIGKVTSTGINGVGSGGGALGQGVTQSLSTATLKTPALAQSITTAPLTGLTKQTGLLGSIGATSTLTKQRTSTLSGLSSPQINLQKAKSVPIVTSNSFLDTITISKQRSGLVSGTAQVSSTQLKSISDFVPVTPTAPVSTAPFSFSPSIIPPPFIPFSMGTFGGGIKLGKLKTKAKYGYTPSFTALALGIKGKARKPTYKGKYTGLELRPITKGWNIMKALKGSK